MTQGTNPAWTNLPRRKCDDCGKNYKPKQPLREGNRGFCSDTCRKSYHKHGGAYRKLRDLTRKLIEGKFAHIEAELKEQRNCWSELESRYVELKCKVDAIEHETLRRIARREIVRYLGEFYGMHPKSHGKKRPARVLPGRPGQAVKGRVKR
jgi:hypothetical protein